MQQKILLIKRGAMGDILMATPLLRQLRSLFPHAQIDFITSTSFIPALANNPYLNKLITMDDSFFRFRNIFHTIKYCLSIRHKYDYAFALDKHYYFNFLISIVGGIKVGYVRENISRIFLNKYVLYHDINRYHGLYYLDLLKVLGYQPDYNDLALDFFNDPVTKHTMDLLSQKQFSNYIVVINSGGNNAFEQSGIRMLPQSKIIELLTNILQNHPVILIGGGVDKSNYDAYLKTLNNPNVYNLAGTLNLSDSAYILKHATKIYTTDCGAMHLAITQGCQDKMICFFGPTNPNHVLPPNQGIKVYWTDQDIYDQNYALKGTFTKKSTKYFTQLDLKNI